MKTMAKDFRKDYEYKKGIRQMSSLQAVGNTHSYSTYRSPKALVLQKWKKQLVSQNLEIKTGIFRSKNFLLLENLEGPLWSSSRKPPLMRERKKSTYYIYMQLKMIDFNHNKSILSFNI